MNRKYTVESVYDYGLKFSYILLSKEYINPRTKLNWQCSKGHIFVMDFNHIKNHGNRCPICFGKYKKTDNEVNTIIKDRGYKWVSGKYKNAKSILELQCPKGHIYNVKYNDFQQGYGCNICSGNKKHTIEIINNYIESFNYKILSVEYVNVQTKLKLQCPEGHTFKMRFGGFQQGQRCPECYNIIRGNSQRLEYNDVKEYIENFEYILCSTKYKNSQSKLKLQCPEGHIFKMRYNAFQRGQRCPECSNSKGWSKPEKEIVEYVKTIYSGTILENDRTQVKNYWSGRNLELDIYLPEIRKAIEFNGSYWHSFEEKQWYDEMKKKQCIRKGIDLLVIQERDWYNDKLCCLSSINDLLSI